MYISSKIIRFLLKLWGTILIFVRGNKLAKIPFSNKLTAGLGNPQTIPSRAINAARNAAGLPSSSAVDSATSALPWGSGTKNSFFAPIEIDGTRWDKLYPYRLLVVDSSKNYSVVARSGFGVRSTRTNPSTANTGDFSIAFEPVGNRWAFTLPITPEQLSISSDYSIETTSTLRGVLEEHGGMRFKMITAAGSFGIWPFRPATVDPPSSPGVVESLFAGTIENFGRLRDQVGRFVRAASGDHPANRPESNGPERTGNGLQSTGYYHAMALEQFLEQYVEAKRNPDNRHWKLVLDLPKQNQAFVVTPIKFLWNQSAEDPASIKYVMQFKAWKRVVVEKTPPAEPRRLDIGPNTLQQAAQAIEEARRTIGRSLDLVRAVRSDAQVPINALRQSHLLIKDILGIPAAIGDMARQTVDELQSPIKEALSTKKSDLLDGDSLTRESDRAALNSALSGQSEKEGLSDEAVKDGQLGQEAADRAKADPGQKVFEDPEKNFDLFNSVNVNDLTLTDAQRFKIDTEIELARSLTVDDLRERRRSIGALALQISNRFGAGNQTYSDIYGRPAPFDRIQEMTEEEFEILDALYDAMVGIDTITATKDLDKRLARNPLDYVKALAEASNIPFVGGNSKIRVPVPLNLTMEQIASRYLGNPDRWIEIAALNGLRSPYIDENGFFQNLLSNGIGRQITVSSDEDLFVGQKIELSSNTQGVESRRIISKETVGSTIIITLDGDADLDRFTTDDGAKMRAYLPGTVNSQDQIFIPSTLAAAEVSEVTGEAGEAGADPLSIMSGVSWMITEDGDLALDSYGDFRLVGGLSNLIQSLRMAFGTRKGSVLKHPEYGIGIYPGMSNADITAKDIFNRMNDVIDADPRFSSLDRLEVTQTGSKLRIKMSVSLAGFRGVFPVEFQI